MSEHKHCDEVLSVVIPNNFKVISKGPHFFASAENSTFCLIVEVEDCVEFEDENRSEMNDDLGANPDLISRVIRLGEASKGISSYEKIIEHQVIETGEYSHIWSVVFSNRSGKVALVEMEGIGKFEDYESIWIKVIDSIRLN